MLEQQQSLKAINDIKQMMERSSRFISLSGLSGISAGICALVGAWVAYPYVYGYKDYIIDSVGATAVVIEIRYLGYCQILFGIINLWFVGYGLNFWAAGFGILHIIYGGYMWWKYERGDSEWSIVRGQ